MNRCLKTCEPTVIIITDKDVDAIKEKAREHFKRAVSVPDNTLLILAGFEDYLKSKGILTNFTVEVVPRETYYANLSDEEE